MSADVGGPVAAQPARVPRSPVDDFYELGDPAAPTRVGAGLVASVGDDEAVLEIQGELIQGVIWLAATAPQVGDVVEVEARGDLLVIVNNPDQDGGGGGTGI